MTIAKGTRIARRNGTGYDWDRYGSNSMFNQLGGGDNKPTLEQLTAGGYLVETQPVYDPLKSELIEAYGDDGVYVTQKTRDFTVDEIAEDSLASLAYNIKLLDTACREHIDKSSHWTAGPMIWDKAAGGKPKSKAIKDWTEECWTQYFTNKAMLSGGASFDESMIIYPACPYDIGEAFQE